MLSAFRPYHSRRNLQQGFRIHGLSAGGSVIEPVCVAASICLLAALSLFPADKPQAPSFSAVLEGKEGDIVEAVEAVVSDTIIHGTYVYDRVPTLAGAEEVKSSSAFANWT